MPKSNLTPSNIFARLARRRQEKEAVRASGVREVLILLAAERRDEAEVELDADYAANVLEGAGLSEADVEANISLINRRHAAAELAAKAETLRQAAVDAEERFVAADLEEGRRHRAALTEIRNLESAAHRASQDSQAAVTALGDLASTSEPSAEEKRLDLQLEEIRRQVTASQLRLDPHSAPRSEDGRQIFGVNAPSWSARPALALALQERELGRLEASGSPRAKEASEAVAQLKKRVEAEAKNLERLKTQESKLAAQRDKAAKARVTDPAAFRLIRSRPSDDEHRKQHARQQGLAPTASEARHG